MKYMRLGRIHAGLSLVTVYKLDKDGNKVFLRYETPDGVSCDEYGIPLGTVKFKARVIR